MREKQVPTFYTTGELRKDALDAGRWASKNARALESPEHQEKGNEIVKEIAPIDRDIVIKKQKPSAFFGTPIMSFLNDLHIDTLLIAGTTTSGCVRGTVIDGFSYNFNVAVIEECTFDRGQASHALNLFDMNQKYANVITLEEAKKYLYQLKG